MNYTKDKEGKKHSVSASSIRGQIRKEIESRKGKTHFAIVYNGDSMSVYSETSTKLDETDKFLIMRDDASYLQCAARDYLRSYILELGRRVECGEDKELSADIRIKEKLSNSSAVNETVFFANVQEESENESAGFEKGTLKTSIINKYRVMDSLSALLSTEYSAFSKSPEMYRLVHDRTFPNPVIDSYCTYFRQKVSDLVQRNKAREMRGERQLPFSTIEDDALYVLQHSSYNENYLSETQNSDLIEILNQSCFKKPNFKGVVIILINCTSFQNAWTDRVLVPLREITSYEGSKKSTPRVYAESLSDLTFEKGLLYSSRPLVFITAVGFSTLIVESIPCVKDKRGYGYEKKGVTQFVNSRNKRYLRPLSIQCARAQAIRSQLRLSTLQRMFLAGRGIFVAKHLLRRDYDKTIVEPEMLLGPECKRINAERNPDLIEISPLFKRLITVWSERTVLMFVELFGYDFFGHVRAVQSDRVFYGYGIAIRDLELENKLALSTIPILGPIDELFSVSEGFGIGVNSEVEEMLSFGTLKEEVFSEHFLDNAMINIRHASHRMLSKDIKRLALSVIKISLLTDKNLISLLSRLGSHAGAALDKIILNIFGSIFAYAFTLNSGDSFRKGDTVYKATMSEAHYDLVPMKYYDVDPKEFEKIKVELKSQCELKECATDLKVGNICLRSTWDGTDFYSLVRLDIPVSEFQGWQANYRETVEGVITETTKEFGTNQIERSLVSATVVDAPTNIVFLDKDLRVLLDKPFMTKDEVLSMVSDRLTLPGLQCYQAGNAEFDYWITDIAGGNPQKLTTLSAALDVSQDLDDYSGRLLTSQKLNIDFQRTVRVHGNVVSGFFESSSGERIEFGSKRSGCCWCYAGSQDRSVTLPKGTYRMEILAQEGCVTGHSFEVSFSPALSDASSYEMEEGKVSLLYTPLLTTGERMTMIDEEHATLFLDTLYTVNEGYTGVDSLCFSQSGERVFLNKCNESLDKIEPTDPDKPLLSTLNKENCTLKTSAGEYNLELNFPVDVTDFVHNRMQDCVKFNLVCDSASTGVVSTCDSQNQEHYDNVYPVDTSGNVPSAIHSDSVYECTFSLVNLTKDCQTDFGIAIFCWVLIIVSMLTILLTPLWIKIRKVSRQRKHIKSKINKPRTNETLDQTPLPAIPEDAQNSDTAIEVSTI